MTSDSTIGSSHPEDTFYVSEDVEEYRQMLREEEELWDEHIDSAH